MRDRPCLFMRHLRPGMRLDRTFHAASRSHSLTFVHVGSVVATVVIEVSDWHVRGLSVRTHPRCVSPTATGFDVSYCYLLSIICACFNTIGDARDGGKSTRSESRDAACRVAPTWHGQ